MQNIQKPTYLRALQGKTSPLPPQTSFSMDMDDARPFETVHACTPKRIGVRTSSAAAAPAAQAQAEKLPPSLNNMLEFPSLLPPPSMKPAPPSKSRKSKPKKVMMEIDTVGTQNDKSLDFKKGDLVFGPKDGIKEAFYPHVVTYVDPDQVITLPLPGASRSNGTEMVSFKPENHCLSFTSTDVSALQLSRSLSSKVKYAIDLAKDKEGVLAWAQVGGLSDSSETGGVQNQGKKNNKRSRSGTDVVDYLEEKESEKGTVSRDRKKAKQNSVGSQTQENTCRSADANALCGATASAQRLSPTTQAQAQAQGVRGQDLADEEDDEFDLMEEGGEMDGEEREEMSLDTDGGDETISLRKRLSTATAAFYRTKGKSQVVAESLASAFLERVWSPSSPISADDECKLSDVLTRVVKQNEILLSQLYKPNKLDEHRAESPTAFRGDHPITKYPLFRSNAPSNKLNHVLYSPLPINWSEFETFIFGHWNLDIGGEICKTIKDLVASGRYEEAKTFLWDIIPFRFKVTHSGGDGPDKEFLTDEAQPILLDSIAKVSTFACLTSKPIDTIGSPVIAALRKAPGLVLERLPIETEWEAAKKQRNDSRKLQLNIWVMRTEEQEDGYGTLVYQMIHPSNFSGGHAHRHQTLYQDAMIRYSNLCSSSPNPSKGKHYYELLYQGAPSTAGTRNAMAVYPVAALELESLRRLPLDEILRINPLVHKIILNKLKYNPEQMKKLIEYNPFVPEELQGSLLQAAKRVMIDYGTYRRWTYFPDLERRALTGELSQEERQELEERNAQLDAEDEYKQAHPEFVASRKAYKKKYYQKNKERLQLYQAEYYQQNREKILIQRKEYNSRELTKERNRSRDHANLEREREENEWRRAEVARLSNEVRLSSTANSATTAATANTSEHSPYGPCSPSSTSSQLPPPPSSNGAAALLQQHQANQHAFRSTYAQHSFVFANQAGPSTSSFNGRQGMDVASRESSASSSRSDGGGGGGSKAETDYDPHSIKHRRHTSPPQLKTLEYHFDLNPKPDVSVRKLLSEQLEMTPREVQVWFRNRRHKVKKLKEKAERDGGSSSRSPKTELSPPPHSTYSQTSPNLVSSAVGSELPVPPNSYPISQAYPPRTIYGQEAISQSRASPPAPVHPMQQHYTGQPLPLPHPHSNSHLSHPAYAPPSYPSAYRSIYTATATSEYPSADMSRLRMPPLARPHGHPSVVSTSNAATTSRFFPNSSRCLLDVIANKISTDFQQDFRQDSSSDLRNFLEEYPQSVVSPVPAPPARRIHLPSLKESFLLTP